MGHEQLFLDHVAVDRALAGQHERSVGERRDAVGAIRAPATEARGLDQPAVSIQSGDEDVEVSLAREPRLVLLAGPEERFLAERPSAYSPAAS